MIRRSYQQALLEAATGAMIIATLVGGAELAWQRVHPMDVIIAAGWAATLVIVAALYLEDRPTDAP